MRLSNRAFGMGVTIFGILFMVVGTLAGMAGAAILIGFITLLFGTVWGFWTGSVNL